jgi:hypothetical protein
MKNTLRMKPIAKLPYGFGSIQKRRRTYWMIFTNADGNKVQENSHSEEPEIARLMLAERALKTAKAKVAALKAIINEATETAYKTLHAGTEAGIKARTNRRPRLGERLVRGNASIVRTGAKGKGGTR